jgi:hypothetical protein
MKILVAIPFLMLLFQPCKKCAESDVVKGKVVHRSCASIVVQVTDPSHYYLGQAQWQQSGRTPVYQNVFAVKNTCSFPGNIPEGTDITFRVISNDPTNQDCVVCQLWDNPPTQKQEIKVIP